MNFGTLKSTKFRRWLFRLGLLIGGLLFLYQLYLAVQGLRSIEVYRFGFVPLVFISAFASHIIQVLIWHQILTTIHGNKPFFPVLRNYFMTFLPRYIPGTIFGYLSRAEGLKNEFNIEHSTSNAASIIEIIFPLSTTLLFGGIYAAILVQAIWQKLILLAMCIALPCVIWFMLRLMTSIKLPKLLAKIIDLQKVQLISLPKWYAIYILSILQWASIGCILLITIAALLPDRDPFSFSTFFFATLIFSVSWSAGFLAIFAPGGIGVREAVSSYLIASLLGFGPETSSILSVSFRGWLFVSELTWLIISLFLLRKPSLFSKQPNNT